MTALPWCIGSRLHGEPVALWCALPGPPLPIKTTNLS